MAEQSRLPKYIPQLDGMRAIAVLMVMLCHFSARLGVTHADGLARRYGWTGVDLFFVLSGFLITGILLDSRTSEGYFKNFYARRALRIWPLYYGLVLFAFLIFPVVVQHNLFLRSCYVGPPSGAIVHYLALVQNFWMPSHGGFVFPIVNVTWSLAVEEQFYIVWPWLVLLLSRKSLTRILIVILALSPVARALALHYGVGENSIFTFTCFRLDGLAVGALVALWVRSSLFSVTNVRKLAAPIAAVGAIGAACFGNVHPLGYSALALLFGAAVALALIAKPGSISFRTLTCPPMRYTGKVSYCLYLVHVPVFALLSSNAFQRRVHFGSPAVTDIVCLLIGFAVVYAIATVSWYCLESRVLALKKYFEQKEHESKPVAEAVAACSAEA